MNQRYQVGSSKLLFITKISRELACDGNSNADIRDDFDPKYFKISFLKIKFSSGPYPTLIKSPVKASSPYYAWFGSLLWTDRNTQTHTQMHTHTHTHTDTHANFIIYD